MQVQLVFVNLAECRESAPSGSAPHLNPVERLHYQLVFVNSAAGCRESAPSPLL